MKVKPLHEVRIGTIKAAVWENASANGSFYTVTFTRLYRDGGAWKFTDGFGREDLLLLAKVADAAHSWICARPQPDSPAQTSDSPASAN